MPNAEQAVIDLYTHLLGRPPEDKEREAWVAELENSSFENLFYKFVGSPEYQSRTRVKSCFANGHFHSAVVNPETVREYVDWSNAQPIAAIDLPLEQMTVFYAKHLEMFRTTKLSNEKSPKQRYYLDGAPFPHGDVFALRAMMVDYRPKRIVEIGSGFSTAAMLDAADEFGLNCQITCIEPHPNRLHTLLRADDGDRVTLLQQDVQRVPLDLFRSLSAGDILFIDSTHVMKTGSDVHYELFHILPALREGVLVHIHDIQYPFEYPASWIYDFNYSWNEIYAVRAFLMYNRAFKIVFWNSYFRRAKAHWLAEHFSEILNKNCGGSIWLVARGG